MYTTEEFVETPKITITGIKTMLDNFHRVKRCSSPRQQLIKDFYDRLVKERGSATSYLKDGKRVKLKPYTPKGVAIRMGHFKGLKDLEDLYSSCKHSKSFEKAWWYLTKVTVVK